MGEQAGIVRGRNVVDRARVKADVEENHRIIPVERAGGRGKWVYGI